MEFKKLIPRKVCGKYWYHHFHYTRNKQERSLTNCNYYKDIYLERKCCRCGAVKWVKESD